jgi:1-acyl-sn-glycerol-3-phosphate acyltransferase
MDQIPISKRRYGLIKKKRNFILRFFCRFVAAILYRIKVFGRENLPAGGPAVFVCNHVSFMDWLIIAATCGRPIRFVMHYKFFHIPLSGRFFKDARVIPMAEFNQNSKILKEAFEQIAKALENGETVCIFPEGAITKDGEMGPFKRGIEKIIRRTPVPVIPMALNGLWGSFFSKKHGNRMSMLLRQLWTRITLKIGEPVSPENVSAQGLRLLVRQLMLDPR